MYMHVLRTEVFRASRPGQLSLIEEMTSILNLVICVYIMVVAVVACDVHVKWFLSTREFGTLDLRLI